MSFREKGESILSLDAVNEPLKLSLDWIAVNLVKEYLSTL